MLLGVCSIFCSLAGFGQKIEVSEPRLELKDNTIYISYDILNSSPSEKFTVELEVKDENGNTINAAALSGDVGDKVTGGTQKRIAWNLEVDKIEMNADIYVKVYVKAIPPPEPVVVPPVVKEEEEKDHQVKADEEKPVSPPVGRQFSRTGLILQSVAFPGLGLTRYKGDPHWIRGVLGYGCIAGSVILNRTAVNNYNGIIDLLGYEEKNALYEKSVTQDQFSEVLAYTAIAIWVSDLVWTFMGTRDLNSKTSFEKGIRISPSIDPVSSVPLLSLNYKF